MLNNKSARVGILFGVLILALAAIGVASALWSETLTIEGDVTTGNVDVEFDWIFYNDDGVFGECVVGGTADAMTVTMTDTYPGYHCNLEFEVLNVGSIPVAVDAPVWVAPPEIAVTHNFCYADGTVVESGLHGGKCNITFTLGDVAEASFYEFDGSIFAEQYTP